MLLAVFRESKSGAALAPRLNNEKILAVLLVWFVLVVPALFAMLSLKQSPHAMLGTEFTGSNGKKMILLEPEKWVGKEFPLLSHFAESEGSEVLQHGTWNVLLIHTDCPKCREMMAELDAQKAENVAIVVVPSQPNERVSGTAFPVFVLDGQNGWFAETPCVVKLSEGMCMTVEN